jgi:anti-sigma factor RsiW
MTTVPDRPHGAESPDGLLAAYANGSLFLAEQAEVEQWLAMHPAWTGRLELYRAIGGAVRRSAATADAPTIGSMAALWATIDATGRTAF